MGTKKKEFSTKFNGLTYSQFIKGCSNVSQNEGSPTTDVGRRAKRALNSSSVNRRVGETLLQYWARVWSNAPYQTY